MSDYALRWYSYIFSLNEANGEGNVLVGPQEFRGLTADGGAIFVATLDGVDTRLAPTFFDTPYPVYAHYPMHFVNHFVVIQSAHSAIR